MFLLNDIDHDRFLIENNFMCGSHMWHYTYIGKKKCRNVF